MSQRHSTQRLKPRAIGTIPIMDWRRTYCIDPELTGTQIITEPLGMTNTAADTVLLLCESKMQQMARHSPLTDMKCN